MNRVSEDKSSSPATVIHHQQRHVSAKKVDGANRKKRVSGEGQWEKTAEASKIQTVLCRKVRVLRRVGNLYACLNTDIEEWYNRNTLYNNNKHVQRRGWHTVVLGWTPVVTVNKMSWYSATVHESVITITGRTNTAHY